jgi:UDPglucose 6-dehydrogenase
MKIGVIGTGFVGLTTAVGFAHKNFKVACYEKDKKKRNLLKESEIPFYEPHLKEHLLKYNKKRIDFVENLNNFVDLNLDTIFICVGTPSNTDGSCNTNNLENLIKSLSKLDFKKKTSLIIKSTIPPGTTDKLSNFLKNNKFLYLVFCPEFLREGSAWKDFIYPDRVVAGISSKSHKEKINRTFRSFTKAIHYTNFKEAELIKYMSNSLLATLISYSNEISMLANKLKEIDIKKIFDILLLDKRWSGKPSGMSKYAFPGVGFGGYCLPKDLSAIINVFKRNKVESKLLNSVEQVNYKIKKFNLEIIKSKIVNKNSKIGIIGLSFKQGSDDVRETPSYFYIKKMLQYGYKNIYVYDEIAKESFRNTYPKLKINYCKSIKEITLKTSTIILLSKVKKIKNFNGKKIIDLKYQI